VTRAKIVATLGPPLPSTPVGRLRSVTGSRQPARRATLDLPCTLLSRSRDSTTTDVAPSATPSLCRESAITGAHNRPTTTLSPARATRDPQTSETRPRIAEGDRRAARFGRTAGLLGSLSSRRAQRRSRNSGGGHTHFFGRTGRPGAERGAVFPRRQRPSRHPPDRRRCRRCCRAQRRQDRAGPNRAARYPRRAARPASTRRRGCAAAVACHLGNVNAQVDVAKAAGATGTSAVRLQRWPTARRPTAGSWLSVLVRRGRRRNNCRRFGRTARPPPRWRRGARR
jgi:hypothetical protein